MRNPSFCLTTTLFFLLVFFPVMLVGGQTPPVSDQPPGTSFTSDEGGFQINFPSKPTITSKTDNSFGMNSTRHKFIFQAPKAYLLEVDYVDYPPGFSIQDSLDGAVDGVNRATLAQGGKVLSKTTLRLDACEGREIVVSNPDCKALRMRFWGSGLRLYTLVACLIVSTPETEKTVREFMESFAVTGGCKMVVKAADGPSMEVTSKTLEGTPDPKTGWRMISSKRDSFTVMMPGPVTLKEEEARREPIQLFRYTYSSESESGVCAVMVISGFGKTDLSTPVKLQILLDAFERDLRKEFESRQTVMNMTKTLQAGKFPGREYLITRADGFTKLQMFATPEACFMLLMNKPKKEDFDAKPEIFFSSFGIVTQ